MQSYSLTTDKFLDHAAKWSAGREVVTADRGEVIDRIDYRALRDRSNRLSGALLEQGLAPGDRFATLAWNTRRHLELIYATTGAGLVCHTLNPRLTADHLGAIVNEASDRAIAVERDLLPLFESVADRCVAIEHLVTLDGTDGDGTCGGRIRRLAYETMLGAMEATTAWGQFDENAPAGLCYTSGTTGRPKGVLYTHRSNYLHTLRALQADAIALRASDSILVAVPLFHANGWGLPFAAPAVGAKMVLPGRHTDGASLAKLIREESVTVAVGVHTVWLGVMEHLAATGQTLPSLERVLIGGSRCPADLIERMEQKLGVRVQTSWGMTELSPVGTVAPLDAKTSTGAGKPAVGLDLKLTDAQGVTLETQYGVVGRLKVKGASVVDRYYASDDNILDDEGYFDTGDLASIDDNGNLTIRGRTKDLIKSGGEWINPAEIEIIVSGDPNVEQAAVIGRAHPRWGERPVLVVKSRPETGLDSERLLDRLRGKVANWWLPDEVIEVDQMPLTGTGKIDKNRLRTDFA